jgi:hypothetical protein
MASSANGTGGKGKGRYAGENQGGGTVKAPFTFIRDTGAVSLGGSSTWLDDPPGPQNQPDGPFFQDPMRGFYQPPPPRGLPERPILGGVIVGSSDPNQPPSALTPGAYYAAVIDPSTGLPAATGDPIRINGSVQFTDGGTGFGEYVFFGGVTVGQQGKGKPKLTFDPGRYVFAGVRPKQNGKANPVFDLTSNLELTDGAPPFVPNTGPNGNGYAGEIFIFTDLNYVGWDWTSNSPVSLEVPAAVQQRAGELKFGTSGYQAGNNIDVRINLHGLNVQNGAVPADLKAFNNGAILFWQDQNNSVVKYYDNPSDPTSFNKSNVIGDSWVQNTSLDSDSSPELFFKASPGSSLYGVIYQPRGAWTTIGGGSGYSGPLQIIAGGFKVQVNAILRLLPLPTPVARPIAALVE